MDYQTRLLTRLDNALIHQKDALIALVNRDLDGIREALGILEANLELWVAVDYGYKGKEIAERASKVVDEMLMDTQHHSTKKMLTAIKSEADKLTNDYFQAHQCSRQAA